MTAGLLRRLAAEAAGTAFLVATVIGTGLMAEQMTGDAGLQLLANALATAAMLGVLIAVLGPISGAHFNPAVSLAMCLNRNLPWSEFAPYVIAQVSGGILGAIVAHLMFAEPLVQIATQFRGSVALGFSEVVAAFGLVAIILLARKRHTVPLLVASYIGAAYWFTASTSFANPAVTIARMFTDSFSGIRPQDAPLFIAAQLVGAATAWSAVKWIGRKHGTHTGPMG